MSNLGKQFLKFFYGHLGKSPRRFTKAKGRLPRIRNLDLGFAPRVERVVCTIDCVSGWSASVVHRAYVTMSQGIKRPFCLDAHRITDLAVFPIQSFENETLTWLIMPQTSDSLQF